MNREQLKRWWAGKKVISITNGYQTDPSDKSLSVGIVEDVIPVSMSNTPTLVVNFNGESKLCLSTIIEYTDSLWNTLNAIPAKDRYELIMAFVNRFQGR